MSPPQIHPIEKGLAFPMSFEIGGMHRRCTEESITFALWNDHSLFYFPRCCFLTFVY
jgi:hypothetical protein